MGIFMHENKKQDYTNIIVFLGAVIVVLLLMKYVVPYFLPFIVPP